MKNPGFQHYGISHHKEVSCSFLSLLLKKETKKNLLIHIKKQHETNEGKNFLLQLPFAAARSMMLLC